ncbi:hypothetical protein LMJF_14_0770 [Leishmania major strain Friedlin]|uniref:GPI-anchored surface protein n=1 Tax=Leishmania major TaxID=5664 RepID=Q4QFQ6_LEIMA|nr:hypothetical protein LMJF_14_0770 [Leishmania major strain Friedlin]CAG9571266.1 hypothetical_protein_-_conserved [Leishmania major strain Friedlin]CAJ03045.1 hypothetical protein LMJF_14_0770 [Leishmania major strain Friedlin]|eukprot:XP_001687678.1 hypothetical protein LMJF_14_0770 [Leishmania major strain Friedlin]
MVVLLLPATCFSASLAAKAVDDHPVTVHEDAHARSARLASAAVKAALDVKESNAHVLRRQMVREMNKQKWYLLDGDQLIPRDGKKIAHPPPPCEAPLTEAHEETLECVSSSPRAAQTRVHPGLYSTPAGDHHRDHATAHAPQNAALVKKRQCRTERRAPVTSSHRKHKAMADGAVGSAAATYADAETPRIPLDSLRLVIRFEEEAAAEDNVEVHEHGVGKHASRQRSAPHHSRRSQEHSAHGHSRGRVHRRMRAGSSHVHRGHGASVLLRQPEQGVRSLAAAPQPVIEVADAEHNAIERRSDGGAAAALVSADATSVTSTTLSEEDLWHRCLVANSRDSKAALMKALQEGRLREDCLIVAAEVGNDIPSNENSAKGAVAMMSLFVSTLFGAFLFAF